MEPFDTPAGRVAVITDPHGAAFNVIALDPELGA
jgi:predicted enzyme related to lactoylglutathione lyase